MKKHSIGILAALMLLAASGVAKADDIKLHFDDTTNPATVTVNLPVGWTLGGTGCIGETCSVTITPPAGYTYSASGTTVPAELYILEDGSTTISDLITESASGNVVTVTYSSDSEGAFLGTFGGTCPSADCVYGTDNNKSDDIGALDWKESGADAHEDVHVSFTSDALAVPEAGTLPMSTAGLLGLALLSLIYRKRSS